MKTVNYKLLLLIPICVLCLPFMACSQTKFFNELPTGEGIEKVFISKTILSAMQNEEEFKRDDIANLLGGENSSEYYQCDNPDLFPLIKTKYDEMFHNYDKEILTSTEDNQTDFTIFLLYPKGKRKDPVGLVISVFSPKSISITIFNGKINLDGLRKLLN